MPADSVVGFTTAAPWIGYSPAKNSIEEAANILSRTHPPATRAVVFMLQSAVTVRRRSNKSSSSSVKSICISDSSGLLLFAESTDCGGCRLNKLLLLLLFVFVVAVAVAIPVNGNDSGTGTEVVVMPRLPLAAIPVCICIEAADLV